MTSVTRVKFDEFFNFAGSDVDPDRVVDLDEWIRIADSATVTRDNAWDALQSDQHLLHLAQLVLNTQSQLQGKAVITITV